MGRCFKVKYNFHSFFRPAPAGFSFVPRDVFLFGKNMGNCCNAGIVFNYGFNDIHLLQL